MILSRELRMIRCVTLAAVRGINGRGAKQQEKGLKETM